MIINKSQNLGFPPVQLYVACSCIGKPSDLFGCTKDGQTKNTICIVLNRDDGYMKIKIINRNFIVFIPLTICHFLVLNYYDKIIYNKIITTNNIFNEIF